MFSVGFGFILLFVVLLLVSCREVILRFLESVGRDGVAQSELCRRLGLPKSTVSYWLRVLEREGLVVRRFVGRCAYVWLSKYAPRGFLGRVRVGVVFALEFPYLPYLTRLCRDFGLDVEVKFFDNGVEATRALVKGSVDFCISPFVTQLMYGALTDALEVVAVAGCGTGALVVRKGLCVGDLSELCCGRFGSTRSSTMEVVLTSLLYRSRCDEFRVSFFSSGNDMVSALVSGLVDAVNIWEPYVTSLVNCGVGYVLVDHSELLGVHPCCMVATYRGASEDLVGKFIELLKASVTEFERRRDYDLIAQFFRLPKQLVIRCLEKYHSPMVFSERGVLRFMRKVGVPLVPGNLVRFRY
ncbi:MAG: hypothetical protein DRJ40_02250 [Thermoprotei archaeon]|nr:MAG: hypothetical protein DRJ40_02250 [Thermoprotei archaeon]